MCCVRFTMSPSSRKAVEHQLKTAQHLGNLRQVKYLGVSHLLHMAFLPGLCGSLCYPCFVNPALESPPRLLS